VTLASRSEAAIGSDLLRANGCDGAAIVGLAAAGRVDRVDMT
jgi:hypothetical protein